MSLRCSRHTERVAIAAKANLRKARSAQTLGVSSILILRFESKLLYLPSQARVILPAAGRPVTPVYWNLIEQDLKG